MCDKSQAVLNAQSMIEPTGHIFEKTKGCFSFVTGENMEGYQCDDTFEEMCVEWTQNLSSGYVPKHTHFRLTQKQMGITKKKKTKKSFVKQDKGQKQNNLKFDYELYPYKFKVTTRDGIYLAKAELNGVPVDVDLTITNSYDPKTEQTTSTWKLRSYKYDPFYHKVYTDTDPQVQPVFYICHRVFKKKTE